MKRKSYKQYLIFGALLFLLISLPVLVIEHLRGAAIKWLSPLFQGVNVITLIPNYEMERLESENHLLRIEIGKLRSLIEQHEQIATLTHELKREKQGSLRHDQTHFLLGLQQKAIAARVLYRDPGSWSSSVWINVGEETNRALGQIIVAKNSPVIVGRSLVGVIDYAGQKQSRVRLITDVALKPSVRAVRGHPQNSLLMELVDAVLRQLVNRADLSLSPQEKTQLISHINILRAKLVEESPGHYLAKGILQGPGAPLWRSAHQTLRGIGFNYDFADEEGDAQELASATPLIQINDLLITTGIDGVFPPGLRVAEVRKIFPLSEGAYTYEIEATPIAGNLNTLQPVFIIPPLGFDIDVE